MKYAMAQLEIFYNIQLIKVEGNKLSFTEFGHILGKASQKIWDSIIRTFCMYSDENGRGYSQ